MRMIAVANQKGGVGKTTCVINMGAGLHRLGKKVLLVDLDPQAHCTYSLGIQAHELERNIYDLLRNETPLDEIVVNREGLMIIPSSLDLSGAEMELAGIPGREFLLREALGKPKGFDYVLIDCPPSLGLLTLNGFITAQEVYIPLQTEFLALQGMSKLLKTVEIVKNRLNKRLEVGGIIGTRFDGRKRLNSEVVEKIKGYFGSKVFATLIRENIAIAEAPSYGQTIFEYRPNSHGAEDYLNLAKEMLRKEGR